MLSPHLPSAPSWQTLGASVTGTSHHKTGRGCDDAHAIRQLQDGTLLLAVADGAGSASRSAEGAKCAVSTAVDTAEHMLTPQPENQEQWLTLLHSVLESVRATLQRLASGEISLNIAEHEPTQQLDAEESEHWQKVSDTMPIEAAEQIGLEVSTPGATASADTTAASPETGLEVSTPGATASTDTTAASPVRGEAKAKPAIAPLREFATTLLVAIVTPQWVAATQIGDGAVVVQHKDGMLQALTWPDHGEYINEASFITDSDYGKHAQYCTLAQPELSGVALFTDGIERLVLNFATKTPGKPFFTSMFTFATRPDATEAELAAFLASERVCERTDDDKTLVLAVQI